MINDFMEIKDEGDRALYVQIRNIIDDFFLSTIEEHARNKEHKSHECWNAEQNKIIEQFRNTLNRIPQQFRGIVLAELNEKLASRLTHAIQNAIAYEQIAKEHNAEQTFPIDDTLRTH